MNETINQNSLSFAIDSLFSAVAAANNVQSVERKFTVVPAAQQSLVKKIQETSEFLSKIKIRLVKEKTGSKIGIGSGSIAGNTATGSGAARNPRSAHTMDDEGYTCRQNNFDFGIRHEDLDNWAHLENFHELVRNAMVEQQALDRIMIGFNGVQYAATSNRVTYPLLQDVNIGWLQKIRTHAPAHHFFEVVEDSNKIRIGSDARNSDFRNLDALVLDATNSFIAPQHRENTKLVAIVGRDLLHDKYFPLVNKNQDNSESLAADTIISQKRIGGLQAVRVPYFPANTILITTLDNLAIYEQIGGRRRALKDEPEHDRIANYESSNDDYVVENYDMVCLIENITHVEPVVGGED